jgi:hypothetical protein
MGFPPSPRNQADLEAAAALADALATEEMNEGILKAAAAMADAELHWRRRK